MAVAREKGVDPENLDQLYEVIAGDELDALFQEDQGEVTFAYAGYQVTVDYRGSVSLTPRVDRD